MSVLVAVTTQVQQCGGMHEKIVGVDPARSILVQEKHFADVYCDPLYKMMVILTDRL